jgi:teichuronic acid biosynthesis glycosyltransferase TuaC
MKILVISSLFPSAVAPTAGNFIKERMFRVGKTNPIVVIAPQVWSPFDWLIRLIKPGFRKLAVDHEVMDGVEIHRPKVLSIPGIFKSLDGHLMAMGMRSVFERLRKDFQPEIIDAHFAYPDGFAAAVLAERSRLPLAITLRGSKDQRLMGTNLEGRVKTALEKATTIICVSEDLKASIAAPLGFSKKTRVVGNGVDDVRYFPESKQEARLKLGVEANAEVLISVGNLIEQKGFHRVIELIPSLLTRFPNLYLLVVGGEIPNDPTRENIEVQIKKLGLEKHVRVCGRIMPAEMKWYYSAADVFVLATVFEGWANVFLEAMACGLPVVTTDVGGNREVVCDETLGIVLPFGDAMALERGIETALRFPWDRKAIRSHAEANSWQSRVASLNGHFNELLSVKN